MSQCAVTLSLPVSPDAPGVARREVVAALALDGELAASAALLISEAVTNSVLHARLVAGGEVRIDAHWAGECLRIEVCDEGAGLRTPSPAGPRDGGHGLNLIGLLSRRWGVHTDGYTRVWFELAP